MRQIFVNASDPTARGSGFQLKYLPIWAFILSTNRSNSRGPRRWYICLKIYRFSFQLFVLTLDTCLLSKSAILLRIPGRCSAVIVISFMRQYRHICFAIWVSFWDLVPPILFTYLTVVTLSVFTCTFILCRSFVTDFTAMSTAIISRAFMCSFLSWAFHAPPDITFSWGQWNPHPSRDASVSRTISGSWEIICFPFPCERLWIHQWISSLQWSGRVTSALYVGVFTRHFVLCICNSLTYNAAGTTASAVAFNEPIKLAILWIVVWSDCTISLHFEIRFSTFNYGSDTLISLESSVRPRNSIVWDGCRTDLFQLISHPKQWRRL